VQRISTDRTQGRSAKIRRIRVNGVLFLLGNKVPLPYPHPPIRTKKNSVGTATVRERCHSVGAATVRER
jgi:hypothetical protein